MSSGDGKKRLVKSRSGLRFLNLEESDTSPFELKEPFWIPDSESPICMKCQAKFDFLKRRHHCRRCGNVYCKHCCDKIVPLPRMSFIDPVRVCDACVDVTKKENEFYEKHLKILLSGGNFLLNDLSNDTSFLCYLSSNHQLVMFDGGSAWRHEPVPLTEVSSLKILGNRGSPGSLQINGAVLTFKDSKKELQELHISVASVPNRAQSVAWITALQKALKILNPTPESP